MYNIEGNGDRSEGDFAHAINLPYIFVHKLFPLCETIAREARGIVMMDAIHRLNIITCRRAFMTICETKMYKNMRMYISMLALDHLLMLYMYLLPTRVLMINWDDEKSNK